MKKFKRLLSALFLAGLFSLLLCLPSFAAAAPARVKKVTAKASESSVKLTWKKASRATGYDIYMKTGADGAYTRIASTKKTTYTKKKLKPGKTYYFRVLSYRGSGSKKSCAASYSNTAKAKPVIKATAAPKGFKSYKTESGRMYFSWNKVSNATGYVVYKYDSATKKYVQATKTKNKNCYVGGLTAGKTYKFKVKSYRTVNGVTRFSSFSSVVTKKMPAISDDVSSVHPIWYKATVLENVTANPANGKTKRQVVRKGTKVTVLNYGSICKVRLANNDEVYIRISKLKLTSELYTKKSYSKSLKEDYVNQSGYTSPTKYLIWVSTYTQEYSLYTGSQGKWKLLRTAKVATGKAKSPTSVQIRSITKREKRWTHDDGTYNEPVVYFYYENAFHSRLKKPDGTLASKTIGKPVSGGCIRMYDEDIWYLYENVPNKTTVVIY